MIVGVKIDENRRRYLQEGTKSYLQNGRVVPTGAAPEKFAVSHRAGFSKVYEGDKL
jgi:hypothetical protein